MPRFRFGLLVALKLKKKCPQVTTSFQSPGRIGLKKILYVTIISTALRTFVKKIDVSNVTIISNISTFFKMSLL